MIRRHWLNRCYGTDTIWWLVQPSRSPYGLVFIVGLIGNVLVLVAVFSGGRSMRHSVTNIFLANLAVADLLVIIACLPFTLISNLIYRKLRPCRNYYSLILKMQQNQSIKNLILNPLSVDSRGDHLQTVALPPGRLRMRVRLFFSGRCCRTMPNRNCTPSPTTDRSVVQEDNCNHLDRCCSHHCAVAVCLPATFGEWRKFLGNCL